MSQNEILLRLVNVSKQYDAPSDGDPVRILEEINLDLKKSASLAITGPSGSGKSTLLNLIGGLDRPSSGQVLLAGQDLSTLSDTQLANVRNIKVGYIFQLHHLLPQCTVLENVLIPTLTGIGRLNQSQAQGRARQLLQRVGLDHRLDHRPGELSGGERQRVAVVRALINRPLLLLADEPTGALDRATADSLTQLLIELNRDEQITLIVVSHSQRLAQHMDQKLQLIDGKLTNDT